ncbi:MAG: hypothetical protein P8K10_01930 [Crocinitomicaceae bacterium]|nr:hypothetical protein [Crocinitomicaceae bacterium]
MKSYLLVLLGITVSSVGFSQFTDIEPPHRLGGEVNTMYEENFPIFSRETSTLYFSRSFDSSSIGGFMDQDIWQSERMEEKNYSKGGELHALNNKFNNCVVGFNADESRVYLLGAYHGKKDLKKGIAYAERKGNGWGAPHDLKIPDLDIEGSFYGFHINRESNTIIISYEGPNSKGKEDLYFSQLIDDKWTAPASMGSSVSSTGYEISPFLSDNDDTLYFASNGFGGYGDADIFYSLRTGEAWDSWSAPVNLGEVINTPKFDAYFTIFDHFFYWSSNRDAEMSDIYYSSFKPIPPLYASATGTDVTIFEGSDGTIDLTPSGGVPPYSYKWSNGSDIEDPKDLVKGVYSVIVTDAVNQVAEVEVPINEPDPIIEVVEVEKPAIETIIYFDLNSSFHSAENQSTLKAFIAEFDAKEGVKLHVVSHCDRRDTKSYNIWLSKKRMNRTIDYLVSQGFSRDLITGDYKGEDSPDVICDNCTEEQFTKNRRTVIKVLK